MTAGVEDAHMTVRAGTSDASPAPVRRLRVGIWCDFRNPARWRIPWRRCYQEQLDQAVQAEELGFDAVWVSEHHFTGDGYLPSVATVLGALAMRTARVQLGTAILLAPLHHPVRLAEELAVVDQLSGGRLEVGLAPGYRLEEFDAMGVERSERGSRTDEAIEVLRLAWQGQPFSYEGRHHHFETLLAMPPPWSEGGPPLWVGGSSVHAAARAARYGCGFMPDAGAEASTLAAYRSAMAASGSRPRVATGRMVFVAPTREEAWSICGEHFLYQFNEYRRWGYGGGDGRSTAEVADVSALSDVQYFVGTPDDVVDAILRAQTEIGFEDLMFWSRPPGMPIEAANRSLELIARDVLPAVREAVAVESERA